MGFFNSVFLTREIYYSKNNSINIEHTLHVNLCVKHCTFPHLSSRKVPQDGSIIFILEKRNLNLRDQDPTAINWPSDIQSGTHLSNKSLTSQQHEICAHASKLKIM